MAPPRVEAVVDYKETKLVLTPKGAQTEPVVTTLWAIEASASMSEEEARRLYVAAKNEPLPGDLHTFRLRVTLAFNKTQAFMELERVAGRFKVYFKPDGFASRFALQLQGTLRKSYVNSEKKNMNRAGRGRGRERARGQKRPQAERAQRIAPQRARPQPTVVQPVPVEQPRPAAAKEVVEEEAEDPRPRKQARVDHDVDVSDEEIVREYLAYLGPVDSEAEALELSPGDVERCIERVGGVLRQ